MQQTSHRFASLIENDFAPKTITFSPRSIENYYFIAFVARNGCKCQPNKIEIS